MPELPYAHSYEQQNTQRAESELTWDDRERLRNLFLEAEHYDLSPYDRGQGAVELRIRIRDENGKAAQYLLEQAHSGEISVNSLGSYRHMTLLDLCASPQHAREIGALLTKDEIIF